MNKIGRKNAMVLFMLCLGLVACQRAEENGVPNLQVTAPQAAVKPVGAQPAPVTVAVPSTPASPGPTPKSDPARPASTVGPSSAAATNSTDPTPILRAVRTGQQPGVDRLVFEFDSPGMPAWRVEYVDRPVRDCGSGDAVPVAGDAWLQIRFTGAQAHTEEGAATSGPRRRPLAQPIARELVRTCDFEGEVTWVVGVARPNPYTANAMSAPSRLVIDIAH